MKSNIRNDSMITGKYCLRVMGKCPLGEGALIGDDLLACQCQCMLQRTGGNVPLQKLENFIFLTVKSCNLVNTFRCKFRTCIEEKQFYGPNWPKFCTFGEYLLISLKISLFWLKSIDLGWKVVRICQNIFKISLQKVIRKIRKCLFYYKS